MKTTLKFAGSSLLVLWLALQAGPSLGGQVAGRAAKNPKDLKAVVQWISRNAVPLTGVAAGSGFEDLQPLKKILKDARIVALGEATHGSREFFQFKHRMLEFLVREMGFTVFAIEASYPACRNINDFVLHGRGDRAAALASQKFWTWDTHEVSDMIDWMRDYNRTAPEGRQVEFWGYDLQHLDQAMDIVLSYFRKVGPEYSGLVEAAVAPLRIDLSKVMDWGSKPDIDRGRVLSGLFTMTGLLAFHQTRFTRLSSPAEYESALQHARVLVQEFDAYSKPGSNPGNPVATAGGMRDLYMAENIEHLIRARGTDPKVVVWAHNGHISKGVYGGSIPAMGSHLRNVFGDAYYALGFAFNQGSFQSRDFDEKSERYGALVEFSVGPEPPGSVGWYLSQTGMKTFVLDFRSAPQAGPAAEWLRAGHPMRSIGAAFSPAWDSAEFMDSTPLAASYDGLFFIDRTSRARPNPTGERGPLPREKK